MKVLYCNNNKLLDVLVEHGIVMTCNKNMEITVSDEDVVRIPVIIEQFAPAAYMDYSIEEKITTLDQFAELINSDDDWKSSYEEIIIQNGWKLNTGTPYGICETDTEILAYNEKGIAIVMSK